MTATVVWYVHDHGRGHLERARAVLPHLDAPVVVAAGPGISAVARSVLDRPVVALPSDVPDEYSPTVGPWHHAPSGRAVAARSTALAGVITQYGCTTAVVDVSVEVTVLARLFGLRVVTLRQSGHRDDEAHRIGLATANRVWVPQHPELEPLDAPPDDRWTFTGPFSRFDEVNRPAPPRRPPRGRRLVVLMVGRGETSLPVDCWREAAAPSGWQVVIVGSPEDAPPGAAGRPDELDGAADVAVVGFRDPVFPLLVAADVVVTGGGWAAVADTVAAGARLVVVPEARPFDEQHVRADALAAAGLALTLDRWPLPGELAETVDAASELDVSRWSAYHDGRGAARAAHLIDAVHAA